MAEQKKVKTEELLLEARNFLNSYKKQIGLAVKTGKNVILLNFEDLASYSHTLAELLISNPEETLQILEVALEESGLVSNPRIRFLEMPQSYQEKIRNLRAKHLSNFIQIEGIVRQASEVRPQVVNAKFECPSCGSLVSVLQIESKFREPSRCSCGRKGGFKLISKDMVDAQRLVIEESPESLSGGEQPRRISVFLKEDLVEPKMEEKTTPGSKIKVLGILKEVIKHTQTGSPLTRYDIAIEANNMIPLEETFEEFDISEEDERQIQELAADPEVFKRFADSIAPSIYGYDEIKQCLVLQLFGGVKKIRSDGTQSRGDLHVLLVGDPGCLVADERVVLGNGSIVKISELGKEHLQKINVQLLTGEGGRKRDFARVFHFYKNQPIIEIVTETGKSIKGTYNHPLLTISNKKRMLIREWKRLGEFKIGDKVAVVTSIPCAITKAIQTNFGPLNRKAGKFKNKLPEYVDQEFASFLGYLLGDGWVSKYKVGFVVAEPEKDILPHLIKMCDNLFGTKLIPKKRKLLLGRKVNLYYSVINSIDIANCLSFLKEKRVPDIILKSGNKVVASFLRWLYEADGSVFNKGRGRRAISLKSKNIELLKDVQILLLRFAVHSRIVENSLMIRRGRDIIKFSNEIGFASKKKKKILKKLALDAESFKRFKSQRSEKIVKIIHHKPEDVFDIEVPKSSRFIANGIISHNTAKSVTLKFISQIAPKGRYVAGRGTSIDYSEPLLIRENNKQKFVKIGEFIDRFYNEGEKGFIPCSNDIEALSLNLETLKLEWRSIKALLRHENKERLLSFSLETGRKIKVTKDHSIFCIEKGEIKCKPSNELKIGDYVIIPKIIPSNELDLAEDVAKFLGYFIAEGNLYNKEGSYKIQFTLNKNEINIASEIKKVSEKYFKKEAKISEHGKNGMRLVIYGKEPYFMVCSWLGNIAHKLAKDKGIPEIILNSNQQARQAFFNSYILGDAGVTKSERLMSELLYLKLQDKIIASCVEIKMNKISLIENREIIDKGSRFDLKSPKINREFKNLRLNFPINCLPDNLKILFKKKMKSGYNRINLERVDNNMLFERMIRVFREEKLPGKRIKGLFGENSVEYFSEHPRLFLKEKKGREIEISLTKEGTNIIKNVLKLRKLLESDISFVKIKKIEETESTNKFVYDISTSEENFVAGFGGIVCHNTGAGLTATVVRDEFLRGWALEAGAMVLSNKGIICIDEIEKMDAQDRSAMHEAMEQQCVSISKANIQATLRSETSVLAAGNPKFGRFDPYQTVASQIDIPPALINRFDVIFIMKDLPDRAKDELIATHVLLEHKEKQQRNIIDRDLFRKYIAYSKQRIKPQLTDEAIAEIKKFYVELRNTSVASDQPTKPLPISARQLEALIRMSEAMAKLRLSSKVSKEDAKKTIEIMKFYLMQVGYDYETKTFDIDRIATGVSTSQRSKIILVREALSRLESRIGKFIPIEEVKKELEGKVDIKDVDDALDKLTISGDIFHPRKGFVQRM